MRLEYFQMVDRIVALDPDARTIRMEGLVPEQSPIFEGHFPGHPILPGVLMIEAMAQAAALLSFDMLGIPGLDENTVYYFAGIDNARENRHIRQQSEKVGWVHCRTLAA